MAKVLLVDDDEEVRYALGKYLRRAGHEVVEAENGKRALALLAEAAFDVVITDIVMPDTDGIEVIMHITTANRTLPVIAISGGGRIGRAEYLDLARHLGAKAVVPKPVDPDAVLALIDQVLAGN